MWIRLAFLPYGVQAEALVKTADVRMAIKLSVREEVLSSRCFQHPSSRMNPAVCKGRPVLQISSASRGLLALFMCILACPINFRQQQSREYMLLRCEPFHSSL